MIIDFHAHCFPDKIAFHALSHMQSLCHNAVHTNGTEVSLIDSMEKAGITRSVILPVATNPEKVVHINDLSIQKLNNNKLIYFGCMHPDFSDYNKELSRIYNAGIRGIKLHPQYQGVDINDIRYLRILNRAAELGLIVVIHAGKEPSFPDDIRSHPKMIRTALDQVGPVKMVCAHMGGLFNWDCVADYLADTQVYIDTSFALGKMGQTEEHFYSEEQLQLMTELQFCKLLEAFGEHRVLFGTDSPWNSQKGTLNAIKNLPLSTENLNDILFNNASDLLNSVFANESL